MARVIRETYLEIYVKQWLKANQIRRKAGFDLLRKAAAYIDEKIATDCCDPLNPVIDLHTRKESVFVRDVYTILFGMSRRHHIQSLTRTRDAILNYVSNPCCFDANVVFAITGPTETVHSASDPYVLSITFSTSGSEAGTIGHTVLFVDGVAVATISAGGGTLTYNIPNEVGSKDHNYYLIAYNTDQNAQAESVKTTFTLINP